MERSAVQDQRLKDTIRQVIQEDQTLLTPNSCEIAENSKGEARITVKCYASTLTDAIEASLTQYLAARQRLNDAEAAQGAALRKERTL